MTSEFRMSLFEKFSYRKKEKMVVNGKAEKEKTQTSSRDPLHTFTPNKAQYSSSADVTSIPETPDSLLPVHPSQKRKQKRRRARISSSSDEDGTETVPAIPPVSSISQQEKGSCSLFSQLPLSKRRKKEANNSQAEAAKPEECESELQQGRKWTSGFHSNPKRLFGTFSGDGEGNVHLPSSSSCSEGKTAPAVSRGKPRKGKDMYVQGCGGRRRRKVIELSSDSDAEESEVEPSKLGPSLHHANGGWLTTRGGVSIQAKLQEFSFQKKRRREKGEGKTSLGNGVCEKDECICISSGSSQSDSSKAGSVGGGGRGTSSLSSHEGSSPRETSQDPDASCIIVDSPTAESTPPPTPRASCAARFYGRRATAAAATLDDADSACMGYRLRSQQRKAQEREELEEEEEETSSEISDSDEEDCTVEKKEAVLEFLNGHDQEELCDIPGCSPVKAKLLTQLRPFRDWSHLLDVLSSRRSLGEKIIDGCFHLLEERSVMKTLLSKCQAISATIQECLSKLTASPTDTGTPGVHCTRQPKILSPSVQLKPYQLVGLNWLAMLHAQNLNGILADEMGLGKTVQAIAFLAHLFQRRLRGIFLVIVPTSTIENWAREFEKWCPELFVQVYHGTMSQRAYFRDAILSGERCDVILSTYQMCIGQFEDRKFFRRLCLGCVVFDEAHMLKNMTTQRFAHLMRIKAKRRLLLTGTPLQNNLLELVSLLSFVMPEMFNDFSLQLKKTFSRKIDESSSYYRDQVKQAKLLMQPFILRRLKSQVLKQLPGKVECTECCRMTETQHQLYSLAVEQSQKNLPALIEPSGDMTKSISVIMELRKIAMHPLLVRQCYDDSLLACMSREILQDPTHRDADPALVFEDMCVMSDFELHNLCLESKALSGYALSRECLDNAGKFQFLKTKLQELKNQGSRVLLFSQFTMMLDVLEEFLRFYGHAYLRLDGSTVLTERQKLIDQYNNDRDIFVFLLSTRAGGLGVNLTSANVVILYDIDFNPHNDRQAQDRCHRVGQTREVTVIRLISKGTIEEAILQCAETKLKLEQDLSHINADDGPSSSDVVSLLEQGLGLKE